MDYMAGYLGSCAFIVKRQAFLFQPGQIVMLLKTSGILFGSQSFPSSSFGWIPDSFYSFSNRAGLGTWHKNNSQTSLLFLLNPLSF